MGCAHGWGAPRCWIPLKSADHLNLGVLVALCGMLAALPWLDGIWLLAGYAACFGPYALAMRGQPSLRAVMWTALVARVVLVGHDPVLSDDLYRYVWEGRVFLAGFNPFVHAPADATLAALRDAAVWPFINHPEVPTIYPPAAQLLFAFNALWDGGLTSLRLVIVGVELGLFAALVRVTRVSPRVALIWALNPLVVVETAWSGHIDAVAALALALGMALWQTGRAGAGFWLGWSIATKFLGIVGLGLIALAPRRRGESWRQRLRTLAFASAVVAVTYIPFVPESNPRALLDGFGTYAATWRSNDGAFRVWADGAMAGMRAWGPSGDAKVLVHLDGLDAPAMAYGWTKTWQGQVLPNTTFADDQIAGALAKAIAASVVLLVFSLAAWVRREPWDGFGWTMLALLFVAPTVHPWYVVWLLPFAALRRDGWARAALVFSATVLFGYLAWWSFQQGGPWQVPWWATCVEFGVVGYLALWSKGAIARDSRVDGI